MESGEKRATRMAAWDHLVVQCVVGDISKLYWMARDIAAKQDVPAVFDALASVVSIVAANAVIRQCKDERMKLTQYFMTELLLRCVQSDSRYAVHLVFIRSMDPLIGLPQWLMRLSLRRGALG